MALNSTAFKKWLQQPTTVTGISALVGTICGVVSGSLHWQAALPIAAGSIVAMALPDNAGAKSSVETMMQDGINAALSGHLQQSLGLLAADGLQVVTSLQPAQPAPMAARPMHGMAVANVYPPGQAPAAVPGVAP